MNNLGQLVIVDLYCCGGGASEGYARAGFDVYGVDLKAVKGYPFSFVRMDAIEFLTQLIAGESITFDDGSVLTLDMIDGFAASPPCQVHSALAHLAGKHHIDLVPETRALLDAIDKPYIIENVPGAPLLDPVVMCGSMFRLGAQTRWGYFELRRHRHFESNIVLTAPGPCAHGYGVNVLGIYGTGSGWATNGSSYKGTYRERVEALGIDWLTNEAMAQAIPPAFTEWLGTQLHNHIIEESYT